MTAFECSFEVNISQSRKKRVDSLVHFNAISLPCIEKCWVNAVRKTANCPRKE